MINCSWYTALCDVCESMFSRKFVELATRHVVTILGMPRIMTERTLTQRMCSKEITCARAESQVLQWIGTGTAVK